jgi:hypothetical protein
MRLDKWFPHHIKMIFGDTYYLTSPYYNGLRSDFYLKFNPNNPLQYIIPDTSATHTDSTIVFRTGEVIRAVNLTEKDYRDIAGQMAWLTALFRTLGTPVPEVMLGNYDAVETWVIVYEDGKKEMIIMPTFTETIQRLSLFYHGFTPYFKFSEVRKSNSRLEFFGTLYVRDRRDDVSDFIDVRFHTNRQNEIDLVMFFIYRRSVREEWLNEWANELGT